MSTMHSLSTLEGQKLHYAAVRARLNPMPRRVRAPVLQLPPPAEVYVGKGTAPLNLLTEPSWKFLVALASVRTGVSVSEIMGKSRKHPIAVARHDAIALVYAYTNKSMVSVGKMFGGLDHTTILHIVRKLKAEKLIEPEPRPNPHNSQNPPIALVAVNSTRVGSRQDAAPTFTKGLTPHVPEVSHG